jgi:hypothetical protein
LSIIVIHLPVVQRFESKQSASEEQKPSLRSLRSLRGLFVVAVVAVVSVVAVVAVVAVEAVEAVVSVVVVVRVEPEAVSPVPRVADAPLSPTVIDTSYVLYVF